MGSDWSSVKIEDIGDVKSGKRLPKGNTLVETESPFPYIRLVDVSEGKIRKNNLKYLTEETRGKIKKYIVNESDVCLAIVGHTIGMVFYVEPEWEDANLTENAARITNINENVSPKYLYYFLISPLGQTEILSRKVGSAQGKLPLYNIKTLEVLLPPLPEQKAIAHILGSLDDKIELNRQMNKTLESMAQALYKSWFVDFDPVIDNALAAGNSIPDVFAERAEQRCEIIANAKKASKAGVPFKGSENDHQTLFPSEFEFTEEMGWIPKGWSSVKLNELLEVKYGKDHKKLEEGAIPVYGSGGLMRFVNKSLCEGESILIPRKGTLSNLMFVDEAFWTVDTMFFSIPKLKNSAKYLFYQLKRLDISSMDVGSAVPSMTTKVLNDLDVLKPDENCLKEFNRLVTDTFIKQKSLDEESKSLGKLRDTLLPKLLSGELRIPDAEKLSDEVNA